MSKIKFTDLDGNQYKLVPQVYNRGDRACVGCVAPIGNGAKCRSLPSCTPEELKGKGAHVWKYIQGDLFDES